MVHKLSVKDWLEQYQVERSEVFPEDARQFTGTESDAEHLPENLVWTDMGNYLILPGRRPWGLWRYVSALPWTNKEMRVTELMTVEDYHKAMEEAWENGYEDLFAVLAERMRWEFPDVP